MFDLFSIAHLLILAVIPAIAGVLVWWSKPKQSRMRSTRYLLGSLVLVNELIWYFYMFYRGWFHFPEDLPLHLCDVTLWLTIMALFTLKYWSFELAYFWGLPGSTMAILTPDIWNPMTSYPAIQFFLAHGIVVIALLFLVWGKIMRPRSGSVVRAFVFLNVYAVIVGIFNILFKTNYLYLSEKPAHFSLLDFFGPWPVYILVSEVIAVLFFTLLWIPFRKFYPLS